MLHKTSKIELDTLTIKQQKQKRFRVKLCGLLWWGL